MEQFLCDVTSATAKKKTKEMEGNKSGNPNRIVMDAY
jgi:hypothetical protein